MKFLWNLFIYIGLLALIRGQYYNHKNQALWYEMDGECGRNRQSPIEVNRLKAIRVFGTSALRVENFNIPLNAEILNNGHTADVQLPSNSRAFITGGPLSYNIYDTMSIHWHWGSKNNHGAEHVADCKRYSMEMHIVHKNRKYRTMDEATQYPDGLCVLAVFFDVDPNQKENFSGLEQIVNILPAIARYNSSTKLHNLLLSDLLSSTDLLNFFTYQGSLSVPPCSEAVTWIIFPKAISISKDQIAAFRALNDMNGDNLVNNYRHLQANCNRKVYFYVGA